MRLVSSNDGEDLTIGNPTCDIDEIKNQFDLGIDALLSDNSWYKKSTGNAAWAQAAAVRRQTYKIDFFLFIKKRLIIF